MSLDDLVDTVLAPVRWSDELLLRGYSKLGDLFEEKTGLKREGLAFAVEAAVFLNLVSKTSTYAVQHGVLETFFNIQSAPWYQHAAGIFLALAFGLDIDDSIFRLYENRMSKQTNNARDVLYRQFRKLRFPLVVFAAVSAYHGSFMAFEASIVASSMYIKSNDDDKLRKDPLWTRAYHALFGRKTARQEAPYVGS